MSMDRRRTLAVLGFASGLLLLAGVFFWPESDEERIRARLHGLSDVLRFSEPIASPVFFASHLSEVFQSSMTPSVQVHADEAGRSGLFQPKSLALITAQVLATRFSTLEVSFENIDIDLRGESATVVGTAVALTGQGGTPTLGRRPVRFSLTKIDGKWLVNHATIGHPSD